MDIVISGTGLFTPPETITNHELVTTFNEYVEQYNQQYAPEIQAGTINPLSPSNEEFIEKASGIKCRHVLNRSGILNPKLMRPELEERSNEECSIQAEIAIKAAEEAMKRAHKKAQDIDLVICACSNMQRPYPAMAIEVQQRLGIQGYAYDLNVACSSATFGLQAAYAAIKSGLVRCVLMVNPEICSGHLNFRDRESHFIFGDAATAVIIEQEKTATASNVFSILGCKLKTEFSNNIRNNAGFLNRTHPQTQNSIDKLFMQQGKKVFKEVIPIVVDLISAHLNDHQINPTDIERFWLHQANLSMNQLLIKKLSNFSITPGKLPSLVN